jgi:formyltetrahydrofolate hydrolase
MRVVFEPLRAGRRKRRSRRRSRGSRNLRHGLGDPRRAPQARALILVSKQDHCLNDLLYRTRIGALADGRRAIASNHRDAERSPRATACRSITCR